MERWCLISFLVITTIFLMTNAQDEKTLYYPIEEDFDLESALLNYGKTSSRSFLYCTPCLCIAILRCTMIESTLIKLLSAETNKKFVIFS